MSIMDFFTKSKFPPFLEEKRHPQVEFDKWFFDSLYTLPAHISQKIKNYKFTRNIRSSACRTQGHSHLSALPKHSYF